MRAPKTEYRGARGSNAGDDFHELWAARQAIGLLSNQDGLAAIALDGTAAQDETGAPADTWDGVDCTLYFGGCDAETADRVDLVQLKYSAANPNRRWTVARLVEGESRQSSVINKLARAWRALVEQGAASPRVILVSNQPVAGNIDATLKRMATSQAPARKPERGAPPELRLAYATGLEGDSLRHFAAAFTVSGGAGSRFLLEEQTLEGIGEWTDQDVQAAVAGIRDLVRRRMLPETAGEPITRQSMLTHFGCSDPLALLPCPSEIVLRKKLVRRAPVRAACELLRSGVQYLCLHGHAGVGKTAALEEIESALPAVSVIVKYDCYGGGRYLDPSALRHRPKDAFRQLTNDLAVSMRLPLLLSRRDNSDYPRLFAARVRLAAEVLASQAPEALIVVAIDGADNAVFAAASRKPAEASFVEDFVRLTGLPANVRFLVTTRTGRLGTLGLPNSYESVEIKPFSLAETGKHVKLLFPGSRSPSSLVRDFHHYSDGVPRTQRYAAESGQVESLAGAVERLQPSVPGSIRSVSPQRPGRSLNDFFEERFQNALKRNGSEASLQEFCAGLVALARPVPVEALAAVLESTVEEIRDLCADLAPGIRLEDGSVGFFDEDLETFVRAKAEGRLTQVRSKVADWMCAQADASPYAALNVAASLHAAGRGPALLELVEKECAPGGIHDPTLRREAEVQRLQLAIRVCRASGDSARALRFVLMGADGVKTERALRDLLVAHPDLAVRFAPETAERLILFDPDSQESHGPLLMQKLAVDAERSDAISVRAGHRALREWFRARANRHEAVAEGNARPWRIQVSDVESTVEAAFKIGGPMDALKTTRMWMPKQLAVDVALSLPYRLISEGRASDIEALVASGYLGPAASLFLLIPLALAGRPVDPELLARGLGQLGRRGLRVRDFVEGNRGGSSTHGGVLRTVMTSCEVLTNRRWALELVDDILARFLVPELRRIDKIRLSHTEGLDLLFRAYALREARAGRSPTVDGLFKPRPQEDGESERPSRRWDAESYDRSVRETAVAVSQGYTVVARALVNRTPAAELEAGLLGVQRSLEPDRRRVLLDHDGIRLRRVAAANVLVLLAAGYSPDVIKSAATGIRGGWRRARPDPGREFVARLSLWRKLHASLIEDFGAAAAEAEDMRIAADEKVEILVKLARYTRPLSESDARAIFSKAVAATGELDYEVVAQIRLLERLVRRGGDSFSDGRGTARRIGDVVEDAAIRLDGYYGDFPPWEEAMSALARLDAPLALASSARWDESDVGLLVRTLPAALKASTERGSLKPSQAAALSLMTNTDRGATASALQLADQTGSTNLAALAEEAAYDHLVHRTYRGRAELVSCIERNQLEGRWSAELARREEQREPPVRRLGPSAAPDAQGQSGGPLEGHVWSRDTLVDSPALQEAVEALRDRWCAERPLPVSSILASARRAVSPSDRQAHVEALARFRASLSDTEPAASLLAALDEWHGSPAIASWCRERLPDVIEARFHELSRWVAHDEQELSRALALTELAARQAGDLVLRGVERHVGCFKPDSILALAGLMSGWLSPPESAALTDWYSVRLWRRIPAEYRRSQEALGETPVCVDEAVARFLFTYMGDCDVRLRWRAAHATRRLARLGQESTLKALVGLYDRREELAFRERESCFYWLAARLWFVVTWDRIAGESAVAAGVAADKLLQIALDESFPHMLVRSFARDACKKLVATEKLRLSSDQRRALEHVNRSALPPAPEATDVSRDLSFWVGKERFRFDSMDTLPYWYEPMLRSFSRVSGRQFLEEAERWILDVWYPPEAIDAFEARESRGRFGRHDWQLSRTSHGAMPTLERLHTHVEWHAMWCAAGALLKTEPLACPDDGLSALYSLENRIENHKLTEPPLWSADLLVPAPVDQGEREELPGLDEWLRDTCKAASPVQLLPKDASTYVIVDGFTERRRERRRECVSVRSALVSPATASSLLGALQTMEDPWDYGMPFQEEGHTSDSEIDELPYRLLAWLVSRGSDSYFDEKDPLREYASSIACRPGPRVTAKCKLSRDAAGRPLWFSEQAEPMFVFEAWGTSEKPHATSLASSGVAGHRLLAHREQLRGFLEGEGLDAICKVEVTRHERTREYAIGTERSDEGPRRAARVYRLRGDGGLEIAEASLGTWTGDRSTA